PHVLRQMLVRVRLGLESGVVEAAPAIVTLAGVDAVADPDDATGQRVRGAEHGTPITVEGIAISVYPGREDERSGVLTAGVLDVEPGRALRVLGLRHRVAQ